MNRSLLTPRWLLLHALFLAAVIATGVLTGWQWDRAHEAGGSFQNLGYALQWPLFGLFTLFFWYRLVRMDAVPEQTEHDDEPAEESTHGRPLVPPQAPRVSADDDPQMAEYNRYLAELDEADRS
ncbi:hypothetical protein GIY23_18330 [Allosaccharopolyspora coralli]|uniref:Uncharacterized protein n=1 Tax=Allosaccharopolyspora coralli TaxID=2665642 RepID=A0A5Q3QK67_9PSEU|nr:hypothetical protein [Allosaccharopolyspora coralli]QGK71217.1 hypothetical protein GIY23_18330 [Allosaccharopolyspora coralli]